MSETALLTAGRYGYGHRRVHRDDFARVVAFLVFGGEEERTAHTEIAREDILTAAAHCLHLAARFPGEPLARVGEQAAYDLLHPAARPAPGELLLYATALLCREQEALCVAESSSSVPATLESRSAHHVAEVLETAVSAPLRYSTQTSFDGDFVRGARDVGPSQLSVNHA